MDRNGQKKWALKILIKFMSDGRVIRIDRKARL